MIYCGGAQIFQSCQPTAVGEGQRGACVGFHGLAEGAAGAVVCLGRRCGVADCWKSGRAGDWYFF